jgi:hypothetical protein
MKEEANLENLQNPGSTKALSGVGVSFKPADVSSATMSAAL